MKIKENIILTQEQLWTLERINDRFAQSVMLADALITGLETLLLAMGRSGAALYLPRFCEHIDQDWHLHNVPSSWHEDIQFSGSAITQMAITATKSKQPLEGSVSLAVGAVIPVGIADKVFGALLLTGQAVPAEEYEVWQAMLRPFARLVSIHINISGSTTGSPKYLDLLRSRNTLRAMFDSLPISIYIIDNTYHLVAINHSRAARAGARPNQLVRRVCYEALYNRTTVCPGCKIADTFANAHNTVRLSRTSQDANSFIEWEINTFPIFEEKDVVSQTIVIEQDVTDKRTLEANLIQSEKLAAVGQLAAGVAHEINNPLTAIIANAQLLRREIPANFEDQLDSIKLIEMAGTRASQVVRNLLGIARKEKYDFEPIDLNETIHNSLSLVQHELVGRPIQVRLSLADDLPPVLASQDQLQGVWINLILNAIDALDKEEGLITIQSRFAGLEFFVTITDNGKGIAQELLPRVFEPFFTTKALGRGTGLGLSVCLRAIRYHGGNIQVDSQLGQWTRFTVSLPNPQ